MVATLMLASLSGFAAGNARAELRPVFGDLRLFNSPATLPTIEVEAEGQDWTRVSTETLHVTTSYYVSLEKGDIITIVAAFSNYPISKSRHPGGGKRRWGEFSFEIPNSQMGTLKGFAVSACNNMKQSGARTDKAHTAYVAVPFTLFVRAERVGNQSTKTVNGNVQAKVVCKMAPKYVRISRLDVEVDSTAKTCPKTATVYVEFRTNRSDRIDFTLEHMNRGELQTSEHFVQPFQFGEWVGQKKIDLVVDSNTSYVQVELKDASDLRPELRLKRWTPGQAGADPVTCPRSFKVTSAWLKYDIEDKDTCPKRVVETATFKATAPGKAPFEIKTAMGAVVHSGTADFKLTGMEYVAKSVRPNLMIPNAFDSDMMADVKNSPANSGWVRLKVDCPEALSGKLTLRSLGATSCRGEALVAIHANGPGELPYELECGPGRSWQRSVEAPANKIGVDKVQFDVKNNELVTCALRARISGKLKSLDGASRIFQCHRPSAVGGSNDLVPETRPDPGGPRPPRIMADPPRVCPHNAVGRWPNCRPRPCPRGTVGTYPDCRKKVRLDPPRCPPGMVGRPPNCRPRPCPPGRKRVRGQCIRPAG
jgi:hypothetical protein